MKYGIHARNPLEWIAYKANLVPTSISDGAAFIFAKTVLTAHKLGIFEAAKDSPQTIEQIAQKANLNPRGLSSFMNMLTNLGYFKYRDGKYGLSRNARKWCLKDSPDSIYNLLIFTDYLWDSMNYMEEYLKTGKGMGIHDKFTDEQWQDYQLAMEIYGRFGAKSLAKMVPMPGEPTEMLDIGGSHGLYCVELCKKYPTLKATILELPEAVAKAVPILAKYNMGDRINYWTGDALTDDFGEDKYDLILISLLMHHFSSEQNIEVSRKVARALKPGGCFVIQEFIKPESSSRMDIWGPVFDMLFNILSTSSTWTKNELIDFQQQAGLKHCKTNQTVGMTFIQVCARKDKSA